MCLENFGAVVRLNFEYVYEHATDIQRLPNDYQAYSSAHCGLIAYTVIFVELLKVFNKHLYIAAAADQRHLLRGCALRVFYCLLSPVAN